MDKREAAKCLRGDLSLTHPLQSARLVTHAAAEAGAAALEREAAREEAERPKQMSLDEMVDAMTPFPTNCFHCDSPVARCCVERGRSRGQIASTLKRLAEEGGKLLTDAGTLDPMGWYCKAEKLLRSLGVEPKP